MKPWNIEMYEALYLTHVTCAALSISLFIIRGALKLTTGEVPNNLFFNVAPHMVDTILLVAAVSLTLQINQYPFVNSWLTVKVFAVVGYIILGSLTLKRAETTATRALTFTLSVLLFSFIVSVALYHHPLGYFVWL